MVLLLERVLWEIGIREDHIKLYLVIRSGEASMLLQHKNPRSLQSRHH